MKILGIDPGYHRCGYGIIEHQANKSTIVDHGCIETDPSLALADRLLVIQKQLDKLIKKHRPEKIGIEELFFAKNTKTALKVAHARGVILLSAAKSKAQIIELTPNQVKLAITGYGSADKKQVQEMVKMMLKLAKIPKPDDAADALAIALTTATWQDFSD